MLGWSWPFLLYDAQEPKKTHFQLADQKLKPFLLYDVQELRKTQV
jgi:hypothetical protein